MHTWRESGQADGTTLGADDGIGIAMALAVLQSKTLAAGPIDVLFTVNEEMTGRRPRPDAGILRGTSSSTWIEVEGESRSASAAGNMRISSRPIRRRLFRPDGRLRLNRPRTQRRSSGLDIHWPGPRDQIAGSPPEGGLQGIWAPASGVRFPEQRPMRSPRSFCARLHPRSGKRVFQGVRDYEGILRKELGAVETIEA